MTVDRYMAEYYDMYAGSIYEGEGELLSLKDVSKAFPEKGEQS